MRPTEQRSRGQRIVLGITLAAVLGVVGLIAWTQRPPSLPDRYQELDLPVTGLH